MTHTRKALAAATGVVALTMAGALAPSIASATPPAATYTITVGSQGTFNYPDDTPASGYIDKDGTFYFQESVADYGASQGRAWSFYTGTNFDTATPDSTLNNAVNPNNSNDQNANTTWRCNNSPTGLTSTYTTDTGTFAEANYCDLVGVWVDPDTGAWYGLVHNEFTPEPFGANAGFAHFDAIDLAESTDQGQVWTIVSHVITSPYSTTRNTTAFPNQTWDYGDGDPRLFVDPASGYFYVYYGSRIQAKPGDAGSFSGLSHVARAPISGKMATGTWEKWYDGSWSQPGVGGLESNLVPVTSSNANGYTPVANDYNPANTGTTDQQVAANLLPAKSTLFVMNISYDAYLGLYIGTPEVTSGTLPQQFYVTDNLATQKWYLAGDTGSGYTSSSWYRWLVDGANATNSTILGKTFRYYCSISCANGDNQYNNITLGSTSPATSPVSSSVSYTIGSGSGQVLAQVSGSTATTSAAASGSSLQSWNFAGQGDGSYTVTNASTGQALGVGSTSTTTRAWGTAPTATTISGSPTVGQEWFIVTNVGSTGSATGTYRLVNRYSGLELALSTTAGRLSETTPNRTWTNTTGNSVGGTRTAADQTLTFTQAGTSGTETVTVNNPGSQAGTVGTAISSLQVSGSDSQGKSLTYSASGLPAGLSISSAGLISGTPTTAGTSTVTITASSGTASGSASLTWTITAGGTNLSGTHTLGTSGNTLDDPNWSTATGTQLDTWSANGGQNQSWVLALQSDGSYTITNSYSGLCVDVNGGSASAGATIIQWTCKTTGNSNQRWIITAVSGGYTIASQSSGLLLTTASTTAGALVTQQANTNSSLQHWTVN